MVHIEFDVNIVKKKCSCLQENKSPGPDELHPLILRRSAGVVAGPLAIFFKNCINISP